MIKTLRVTSVLAVILAGVVLAAVLGYPKLASFLPLRAGTGGDKQIKNILDGPSAVERFKTQSGGKSSDGPDTTPPLIKQAEQLAGIINPPPAPDAPVSAPTNLPRPPKIGIKPPVAVSAKFALLSTCCSSNPKFSYACIRLPDKDNTLQWVGVGEQIGNVTIKEIRKESVVCWDGTRDSETPIEAVPETSSLLETGKAANAAASPRAEDSGTRPEMATVTVQPTTASPAKPGNLGKPPSSATKSPSGAAKSPSSAAKSATSAAKPATAAGQPAAPVTPAPSAQITKQEQEKLNRLGDRLKNDASADAAGQTETVNRLINEFKSTKGLPPGVKALGDSAETDPGPEPLKNTLRDEARQRYSGRLTPPRAAKEQ